MPKRGINFPTMSLFRLLLFGNYWLDFCLPVFSGYFQACRGLSKKFSISSVPGVRYSIARFCQRVLSLLTVFCDCLRFTQLIVKIVFVPSLARLKPKQLEVTLSKTWHILTDPNSWFFLEKFKLFQLFYLTSAVFETFA